MIHPFPATVPVYKASVGAWAKWIASFFGSSPPVLGASWLFQPLHRRRLNAFLISKHVFLQCLWNISNILCGGRTKSISFSKSCLLSWITLPGLMTGWSEQCKRKLYNNYIIQNAAGCVEYWGWGGGRYLESFTSIMYMNVFCIQLSKSFLLNMRFCLFGFCFFHQPVNTI